MLDVGFIGHVEAGGILPLALLCKGSGMETITPSSAPTYEVWGAPAGAIGLSRYDSGTLSASNTGSIRGFRTGVLNMSAGFVAGSVYILVFSYEDSGGSYGAMGSFEVV